MRQQIQKPQFWKQNILIDLCLQTFPKLLLLLVQKVTTRSLYPECIANLKLPIDAFYRESRSGVNIAKRNITTGLFGLGWTIDHGQATSKFLSLAAASRVHLFCNLQSRVRIGDRLVWVAISNDLTYWAITACSWGVSLDYHTKKISLETH
jgi:hypothetical protein